MQVDWLTVAAQIVNFLVLVWLLQRFLYGPITRAMERREQRIADRLHEAAEQKEAAEDEARRFREKQDELEARRDRLLAEARDSAEEERAALERAAREEVEQRREEWLGQLRDQQDRFLRDVAARTTERFFSLSRHALAELADADLESRIAAVFAARLKGLEKEPRSKLAKALAGAAGAVAVSSRFDLSANDRRTITKAIHEAIGADAVVDYRRREDLAGGIELKVGSQIVSWNLDAYVESLQTELAEEIGKATRGAERQAAQ